MKSVGEDDDQKRLFHIDVYESENIEINFLLFEMIVLKSVNFNSKNYQDLG